MAQRVIVKHFEDFKGLDYRSSGLKGNEGYFLEALNVQWGESDALITRNGCQIVGQPGGFTRVHTYSYADTATGGTQQETLALNQDLWKLTLSTLTITRTAGAATWGYHLFFDSSTSKYTFRIVESAIIVFSFDCNDGFQEVNDTVWDLAAAIDALADYSCSFPPRSAKVNGNQTTAVITVDAGHTLAAGDFLTLWDYQDNRLEEHTVVSTTATTITIVNTVQVKDNQVIGPGAAKAAGVPINQGVETGSSSSQLFSYYYWDYVLSSFYHRQFPLFGFSTDYPFEGNLSGVRNSETSNPLPTPLNAENKCYFFVPTNIEPETSSSKLYDDYPWKYDGGKVFRAGLPKANFSIVGAGGALTGTYKYKVRYKYYNKDGSYSLGAESDSFNITYAAQNGTISIQFPFFRNSFATPVSKQVFTVNGNQVGVTTIVITSAEIAKVNDWVMIYDRSINAWQIRRITAASLAGTISITISGAAVNVNNADTLYVTDYLGWDFRGATVNGAQANVATLTVDHSVSLPNTVRAGDYVYYASLAPTNTDPQERVIRKRLLTSAGTTSITWSASEPLSFADNESLSTGLTAEVFRTVAGGNIYYFAFEVPMYLGAATPTSPAIIATDSIMDVNLGAQLDDPPIGKERDLPPRAGVGALHQGAIIYARIKGQPNTIGYSDVAEGLDSVPLASNYFDVPPNITGPITAVISDSEDRLAVFKEKAYYPVVGDFSQDNIQVVVAHEGDYGISSQSCLGRVEGTLFGVCPLGVVAIKENQIIKDIGVLVSQIIQNNPNLNLNHAISFNDSINRQAVLYCPVLTNISQSQAVALVLDYSRNESSWFRHSWSNDIGPMGGISISGADLFSLSTTASLGSSAILRGNAFKRLDVTYDRTKNWVDHKFPITSQIIPEWENFAEPSIYKTWLRLKLWSILGLWESHGYPFTVTVYTHRDFNFNNHTQATMTFANSSTIEVSKKLLSGKARSLTFTLLIQEFFQGFYLNGYELLADINYQKEDIE